MPYDIYGEPLESGHCEVHPWVHMPYPCPVCLREHEEYERSRYEIEYPDVDNPYDRGDDLGT